MSLQWLYTLPVWASLSCLLRQLSTGRWCLCVLVGRVLCVNLRKSFHVFVFGPVYNVLLGLFMAVNLQLALIVCVCVCVCVRMHVRVCVRVCVCVFPAFSSRLKLLMRVGSSPATSWVSYTTD